MKTVEVKLSNQTITIREPKVRDLMLMDGVKGEMKALNIMITSLAQMTEEEVLDMSVPDYKKVQEVVQDFLEAS